MLDSGGRVVTGPLKTDLAGLRGLVAAARPDVVAIDSPPEWGREGPARPIERQLQALGIGIFATPVDPGDHRFYRWMRVGFAAFEAVAGLGYALYRGGPVEGRLAIEVFPHASAITLRGRLPAAGTPKAVWRRTALEAAGVGTAALRSVDELDAALAALTGIRFLEGRFAVAGSPGVAVLVLPVPELPAQRYRREPPGGG